MKKIMLLFVFSLCFGITRAQLSDTLLHSMGFYLSPALTNLKHTDSDIHNNPKFGGSLGFRFINKLPHGFFIEGGVGLGFFGYESPAYQGHWTNYYSSSWPYPTYYFEYKYSMNEINWMVPFLAGYKTPKGKVRFQGALGLAFHLKTLEVYNLKFVSGDENVFNDHISHDDREASFGTSFFAIAKAGISIPIKNRINIEILPTARYRMFYFTNSPMDLTQSILSEERPWSIGLDVGLMISLDDPEMEAEYEPAAYAGDAYSYQYNEEKNVKPTKKKLLNEGPKNAAYIEFGGNGILYSLCYERCVYRKGIVNIQARGGFGCTFKKFSIPLGANIALGTTRKKFEAGLTLTMNNFNRDSHDHIDGDIGTINLSVDPSLAFRLESNSHFFLRLALMTHYFPVTGGIMPGVGVSLGGCF